MKQIPRGWLLDVDGTVTHPQTKLLVEESLLSSFTHLLVSGEVISFNSGRSPAWVVERVITPLRKYMGEKLWDMVSPRVTVVGGKGTVWVQTWKINGEFEEGEDRSFLLPDDFRNDVKKLTDEYARSMYFDETKTIIATVEMLDGYNLADYEKDQKEFVTRLRNLVMEYALEDKIGVDPTRIAVDIEPLRAGKGLGTEQSIRILKDRGFVACEWIVIGDSPSDYEASEYLAQHSIPVRFVYVGNIHELKRNTSSFPIEETTEHFDKGTIEYLKKILRK
jgi:hypothetical protein